MSSRNQSYFIYLLLIIAVVIMAATNIFSSGGTSQEITISDVASLLKDPTKGQEVSKIVVEDDNSLKITLANSSELTSRKEPTTPLVQQLLNLGVTSELLDASKTKIEVRPQSAWVGIGNIISMLLPFLLLAFVLFFIMRQAQGSNNSAISFGKSKARMFTGDQPTVTFNDVAGVEEAKEELREVVEFLREPQKFMQLGARIPKGVLLVGPPGTGKTLMAKAVSGEAGVPFFSISGSEFVEMFVGVGASRVRDLFETAKRHAPCIIFVDEIDAVGRHRGAGLGGSHDEREQTLNQILVEMDGFNTDTNVIIIAATNRPDILDPALLRPGRFDRRVILDRPDMRGREAILKVHAKGKPIGTDVDLNVLSRSTPGFVGADLENMVNEAAILAARRNKKVINQPEFEQAIERVIAGPERKSRLISAEEKRIVAYHEAGHAVVLNALPEADSVQKISIISRGMAGGYTMALPKEDRILMARKKLIAEMVGLMGGRAAEELIFDDITSGASNDLERVTKMARQMVTRLGMSSEMGPIVYGQKEEMIFLGREISEQRDYSESVAEKIDQEVRVLVSLAYTRAKAILTEYREALNAVANRLLEMETLTRDEFEKIFPPPFPKTDGTPVKIEA